MDTSTQYDLMGKVAIVTAGGSGNSKAIALELAQAGASVVAVSRPEAEIKAVAEEIRVADRKAVAVVTNLTIREQIKNPVDLTINESCTPIWDHPERVHMYLSAVPKGRVAEPEEIAGAFLFWSSEASDFVTGQSVYVDGGYLATKPFPEVSRRPRRWMLE